MFPGFNNSKKRGTISRGDFDRDGVSNRKDCEPLNFRKQDKTPEEYDEEYKKRAKKENTEAEEWIKKENHKKFIESLN